MEKEKRNNLVIRIFTILMKRMIVESFSFPGGTIAKRTVSSCLDKLEERGQGQLSRERLLDYCICQVYTISNFGTDYLHKWKISHSFGNKAIERFLSSNSGKKYYEDKWLRCKGLSRNTLLEEFKDRSLHPLTPYIYPEYEDATKRRLHNTEAGFFICVLSTLLYTPFSTLCTTCINSKRCIDILQRKFPELYRIRIEAYKKNR